jgi:hypothetical protein
VTRTPRVHPRDPTMLERNLWRERGHRDGLDGTPSRAMELREHFGQDVCNAYAGGHRTGRAKREAERD